MQKGLLLTFILLFSSASAFAQESNLVNNGSVYSQYGVGIPSQTGSSSAVGAGVWGVSDVEPLMPNLSNPAIWGYTVYGTASGGARILNIHGTDALGTAKHTLLSVDHFQLQVPIKKNKLGLSVSYIPYTRVSYQTTQAGQKLKVTGNGSEPVTYQTETKANGGVSRYEVGIGWKINKNISVGYAASLYHLSVKDNLTTTFSGDRFSNVRNKLVNSGTGFGNRFGLFLTLPSLGGTQSSLSLGFTANLPVTIHGQREEQSMFVSGNFDQGYTSNKRQIRSGDVQLPLGLTAGITYKPSELVAISAEGRFQKWSDYQNELKEGLNRVTFKNRLKMGVGLQYFPVYSGSNKFLSHFKYRIGTNYDTGYLKINGENITAFKVSAGLGIFSPSRKAQGFHSSIDINFYYGILGTKDQNLVKQHIFGVKLTLNLAELFFFRPKLQ